MNPPTTANHVVEIVSPVDFQATVGRLVDAMRSAGLLLIAQFDHTAGAKVAGLEMPPTLVLVYGHPRGGTPVMQASPIAALDLPLRVLVREDSLTRTVVAFHPVVEMLATLGVTEEMARRLEPAQQLIRHALGQ